MFRTAVVVPAYNAGERVARVVRDVCVNGLPQPVIVVDDGSTDDTAAHARRAGALVLTHARNLGKGAALRTALDYCAGEGIDVMLTLDADEQHHARDLHQLLAVASTDANALVLGIRDMARSGAPRSSRFSNGISNFFLSRFTRMNLLDTQCGLRRYPVQTVRAFGLLGTGYELEAEVVLRCALAGTRIEQVPISVFYPSEDERLSFFRARRDVPRIIVNVLRTLAAVARSRR